MRFNTYGDRIVQNQVKRSQSYEMIPQCYQMIYYFGDPISAFKIFKETYRKTVGTTGAPYDGSKLLSTIYTVKHLDKLIEEMYNKGELHLTFTEQLCYLMMYDMPFPYQEPDELIKELIKMLREFNDKDKAEWEEFMRDSQEKLDYAERERNYNKGCNDTKQSVANMLRDAIKEMFYYVSPYLERFISKATIEALSKALIAVSSIHNPDDLIPILKS